MLSTYNMAPDAFRVMVPALVMNGGKDRLASAERGRNLAQTIRFGEFDQVEGAGHTLPLQKPEYVSGRIFVFCGERND